jgi:hypothetical protein
MNSNRNLLKAFCFIIILSIFYSCSSQPKKITAELFSGFPAPSTFFAGGGVSTDIKYATLSSPDQEIFQGAALTGMGVGAEFSIGWASLFFGGGADYSKLFQMDSTSELDDKNASGTMAAVYGQVGFYFKKSWRLTFKYFLSSDYTFSEQTLGSKEFVLTKPVSSFGVNLTLGGRLALDINAFTYSEYSLDGTQSEFKESVRPKVLTYGVMYAIRF